MNVLDEIVKDQIRTDIPTLAPGDTVKVSAKVVEGNRERVQVFEGTILRLTGGGITRSLTVRRIASGVGVERTFKVNSPRIEKIEVVRHGVARRAKLYFLRRRVGKAAPPQLGSVKGDPTRLCRYCRISVATHSYRESPRLWSSRRSTLSPG